MHDIVIRGGTIIDGSGGPRRTGDLAIRDGRIAEVGEVSEPGRREIDATGLLVTPGLVDVHTHYDGQVLWDPLVTPSSWHGVTTVVMGNCGVGFAPVAPEGRDFLIELMEGVEDIPAGTLREGLPWDWESFSEYLDSVGRVARAIDVGAQLPHGALRPYVMGERGGDHAQRATPEEIARMGQLAQEAIEAGALGFSTSRTINHKTRDGRNTPSLTASLEELVGIAAGLRRAGAGVLQGIADFFDFDPEFELIRATAEAAGRPMSISVMENPDSPAMWRDLLERIDAAGREGIDLRAQVATRAIGLIMGLQNTYHPYIACPSYRALEKLSFEQRVARMRDPELRRRIVGEVPRGDGAMSNFTRLANVFELQDPPDYEPDPEQSLEARARRAGADPGEFAYDRFVQDGGRGLFYVPVMNYVAGNSDVTREQLLHPRSVPGLGDGGAHVATICDVSFPTSLLTHWGRDRSRGEKLPLEWLVKRQCRDTAELVGLNDRGLLAPGMKADLNLIDFEALNVCEPEMLYDLPLGEKRLVQRARGYRKTLVSGQVVMEDGEHTGALPGEVLRGARPAPA